jgi:hypothetical protein
MPAWHPRGSKWLLGDLPPVSHDSEPKGKVILKLTPYVQFKGWGAAGGLTRRAEDLGKGGSRSEPSLERLL